MSLAFAGTESTRFLAALPEPIGHLMACLGEVSSLLKFPTQQSMETYGNIWKLSYSLHKPKGKRSVVSLQSPKMQLVFLVLRESYDSQKVVPQVSMPCRGTGRTEELCAFSVDLVIVQPQLSCSVEALLGSFALHATRNAWSLLQALLQPLIWKSVKNLGRIQLRMKSSEV